MHFVKQDMKRLHYRWSTGSTPRESRHPDQRLFDPRDGDQVLFLINFYGSVSGRTSVQEGKYMEKRMNRDMPDDLNTEISVFNWMRNTIFIKPENI